MLIDLVTGFLGSGKTTFINEYVKYLKNSYSKIAVLENDYGSINIDALIFDEDVKVETICGIDSDTLKRRLKTKLITLSLMGYERVIVEPSGIFDSDDFFDILNEDEIIDRYTLANIYTILNPDMLKDISIQSKKLLCAQLSICGKIILSFNYPLDTFLIEKLNLILKEYHSSRVLNKEDFISLDLKNIDKNVFASLNNISYKQYSFEKNFFLDNCDYESIFFFRARIKKDLKELINDQTLGNIIRIKGFIKDNDEWFKINMTSSLTEIERCHPKQEVLIFTGENLDMEKISSFIDSEHSTYQVNKQARETR